MIYQEIIERLSRLPSGGVINDQNRYDFGYLGQLLITARAKYIQTQYVGDRTTAKNRRINPVCYQKHWLTFEKDLQDSDCYVLFRCPEVVSIDGNSDGMRYVGTIDGSCTYRRVVSRAQLSTYNKHPMMNTNSDRFISALYDGGASMLELHGNPMLKQCMVECVFQNPLDIPTYNIEQDNFPVSNDAIPVIESMIMRDILSIEAATKIPSPSINNNIQS